jgi:hypothetical protein
MKKGSKIAMLYAFFPSPPCSLFPHVLEETTQKVAVMGLIFFNNCIGFVPTISLSL